MKSRFSTFNDGVLFICKPESDHSSFNAVSQGRNLTMKVKTRLHSQVTKFHQVLIEDVLYSIIDLDIDRDRSEMYLYLEEVRKLS